jgi:hypothetical protein
MIHYTRTKKAKALQNRLFGKGQTDSKSVQDWKERAIASTYNLFLQMMSWPGKIVLGLFYLQIRLHT